MVKLILFLLGLLQTIITAWCFTMSTKVDAATTDIASLQANYSNMRPILEEVRIDVKKLLSK